MSTESSAAAAVVQPPVPKPRVARPLTSPPHQQASADTEEARAQSGPEGPEHSRTPSPVPKPAPPTTAPGEPTNDAAEEEDEDSRPYEPVVLRHKHHRHNEDTAATNSNNEEDERDMESDEQDEGDYENIDAHLDEDIQRQVRRSDYLNWVFVESDDDDGSGSPLTGRAPPSIKLHNHPALKKSQSSYDMEAPSLQEALALKKQFEQHLQNLKSSKEGVRPKNRAPPPPPGSKQRGGGDRSPKANRNSSSGAQGSSSQNNLDLLRAGHKRSQSDARVIDYSDREQEGERRQGQRGEAASGRGAPGVTSGGGGGGALRGQQQAQRSSPHSHAKNAHPHRNKPPDPPLQLQRKHSPREATSTNKSSSSHTRNSSAGGSGVPPPPSYAPPPAPTVTSSSASSSSSGRPSGGGGGEGAAGRTPPTSSGSSSHYQQPQSRRPNPPRTSAAVGGQRGQSAAVGGAGVAGGQDKGGGKDKERTRAYAGSNIRYPPPPPTTATGGSSSSNSAATAGASGSTSALDDGRTRGGGGGGGAGRREEVQVYDRSPKLQYRGGRQGAEKVYELLSKAKASRQDRDRERENRGGQSPGSVERQTSAPGGGEGAAVYAKPKRHAPPPPPGGSGGGAGTKKVGGASAEVVQISEGPPDYTAVMGGRDSESSQAPPPKPVRQKRTQSSSDLTQAGPESGSMPETTQSGAEGRSEISEDGILTNMDVFTIDLRRDGDQGLGLMIVSGKARNSNGDVAEGVFVQKVLPGSLAEKDGRIQAGDMLVRVANEDMVGGALEKAIELLQQMQESIRLRIGRPDASSSVVVVQDGEEQPIYETLERISPTERDLMMKLEKSQLRVIELEGERERAEKELKAQKEKARKDEQALRQQLRELQEMLDSKKAEHDSNVQDLTQTLAAVTIEKTKVEKALDERKNEVETLRQQLSDVTKDKASVDEILKEANHKLQETEDELGQIKHEKSTLWTELVSGRERIIDLEEKLKAAEKNNATLLETIREQAEEISSLKAELGRPCEIPRQPPPLPVKPSEEPPQQLPLLPVDNKSSVGDDDAFEEGEPSPVAPCPYISFVPLQDDPRARHKKAKNKDGEDGRSKKSASSEPPKKAAESSSDLALPSKEKKGSTPEPLDTATATAESGEAKKLTEEGEATGDGGSGEGGEGEQTTVAEQGDQEHGHRDSSEEPVAPLPDFDAVKPLQKLDSRAALHKSQVGGQIKRKKPSRDHLRQMGSSTNLLDAIPDELLEVKESSPSPSPSSTKPEDEREPAPQEKEKEKEREEGVEQTPSKKPLVPPSEQSPAVTAPAHPPKPKPRAAPRRRNQETPTSPNSDASKPLHPQAAPRQKSEGRELSPPPPPESEKSGKEGVNIEECGEIYAAEESHSAVTVVQASPKIHRKEPLMPSPVLTPKTAHSPKQSPSHRKDHGSHESEDHTPKPLPRGHGKAAAKDEDPSANEAKIAELMKKDPSELTVKEKALLAQKAVGAMSHDKTKLPPPVPRKPKPGHGGEGDAPPINSEYDRGRSQSIDEKEEGHGHGGHPSPMHGRRKLPPGAVNIMAGLPMPSAERGRSLTVSTTEPGARERNSLGRNASLQDYEGEKENGVRSSSQEALDQTDHGSPTKPLPKTPPKRPPIPMQKKPSNERPANVDSADNESDASPALGRKMDGGADNGEDESHDQSHDTGGGGESEDRMDLNTILTWSPEVVGKWLNSVGLDQYREVFIGVQGYMLFEMDGHRLKGLGMSSHDDRNLFKKEVKNLKPYADKHKKIIEKQRKEEKKNAKKKKK